MKSPTFSLFVITLSPCSTETTLATGRHVVASALCLTGASQFEHTLAVSFGRFNYDAR